MDLAALLLGLLRAFLGGDITAELKVRNLFTHPAVAVCQTSVYIVSHFSSWAGSEGSETGSGVINVTNINNYDETYSPSLLGNHRTQRDWPLRELVFTLLNISTNGHGLDNIMALSPDLLQMFMSCNFGETSIP